MSITINIHIQNGTVSVFGSDLELANANATDKAVFDKIISAIGSVSHISPITGCNTYANTWGDEEDWEDDEKEDEEDGEQDKEEELRKAFEEILGAAFGITILSELVENNNKEEEVVKKLKEIFGQ